MHFPGLLWFILTLLPLVIIQRLLHREIQVVFFLISRNLPLTLGLFSVLFFPGVFLHELSHFISAKLLGVRTRGFSLVPNVMPDGNLQLGYVETERTDIVRDSLIGLAPLVAGSLFIAYAGIYRLQLHTLWDVFLNGQYDLFWMGVRLLPQVKDFYLWFYLTFAVSSTMLPSESDRHAWVPLGLWMIFLLVFAVFAGAGDWMLTNLAPLLSDFLSAVALLFGLSVVLHVVLFVPFFLIHRLRVYIMKVDVKS